MRINQVTAALALFLAPLSASAQEAGPAEESAPVIYSGSRTPEALRVQVLLDRSRHSPGVIDGIMGSNTRRAIQAFEQANGLEPDGRIDPELVALLEQAGPGEILVRYTITSEDVAGPFVDVPDEMEMMSELEELGYETPAEALAEKFHMAASFLEAINPGADFGVAGTEITVIAFGRQGVEAEVARIEIDKANARLSAFNAEGTLVATFPATIGSSEFPSPNGSMEVRAIAPAPVYYFDPEGRDWGPDRRLTIAAGPNNPVGSAWIDLSEEGYGIHGSPDPALIGKTASHGCVRLTNWDVEALSKAVKAGTTVIFVDG